MRTRTALALAVLSLAATACTPDREAPDVAERTPDPAARPGGVLRVGITEPRSIDPSLATMQDPSGFLVVSALCDALAEFDPVTGELRPAVAERVQSTENGSTLSATLRRDVRMHDGTVAGAVDVTNALSRAAQPQTVSPSADLLQEVTGFEPLQEGTSDNEQLIGVRPVGPRDLIVNLTVQRGDLVRVFAHPIAAPLPRALVRRLRLANRDEEFARQPLCTGPYRMAEPWEPGDPEIRLVRFDGYYGRNSAYTRGGRGYADEIVFRIYPDLAAQMAAFAAGEVDVAHVPEDRLVEARTLGLVVDTPTLRLDYIGVPMSGELFDVRTVRVALSRVVDRARIASEVYHGGREPATGILPPALGDAIFREDACGPNAPASGSSERLTGAGRDAVEALTAPGLEVPFYFNDEFGHRAVVESIARDWEQALGTRTRLVPMEWEAYIQQATGPAGFDGPFRMSAAAPFPSAHEFLGPLFDSAAIGSTNLARFDDATYDRNLERRARRANTPEDQALEYRALEDAICSEMPVIPVVWGATHYLFRTDRVGSAIGTFTARTSAQPVLRELFVR